MDFWGNLMSAASSIEDNRSAKKVAELNASKAAQEAATAKANLEAQTKALALANNRQVQSQVYNNHMMLYVAGGVGVLGLLFVLMRK